MRDDALGRARRVTRKMAQQRLSRELRRSTAIRMIDVYRSCRLWSMPPSSARVVARFVLYEALDVVTHTPRP